MSVIGISLSVLVLLLAVVMVYRTRRLKPQMADMHRRECVRLAG
jgi:hypothetical protein